MSDQASRAPENGYALYIGADGKRHLDLIADGSVIHLVPEGDDFKRPLGLYDPDGKLIEAWPEPKMRRPVRLLERYNPDQPRVPAGEPGGGQWADEGGVGGGGGSAEEAHPIPPAPPPSASSATSLTPAEGYPTSPAAIEATADRLVEQSGGKAEVGLVRAHLRAGTPTNAQVSEGGYMVGDNYTPERAALHKRIIAETFSPEAVARATPAPGQKPILIVLGGRGGSGKSELLRSGKIDTHGAIVIDADEFKKQLGFHGWDAALYHEESDHLVNMAAEAAVKLKVNMVHDATMRTATGSAASMVAHYRNAGYDVEGYYVHMAPEEAASSALQRFLRRGTLGAGRYVEPKIVLSNTDNERNFDRLSPLFKKWQVYDNSGHKLKLVGSGGD